MRNTLHDKKRKRVQHLIAMTTSKKMKKKKKEERQREKRKEKYNRRGTGQELITCPLAFRRVSPPSLSLSLSLSLFSHRINLYGLLSNYLDLSSKNRTRCVFGSPLFINYTHTHSLYLSPTHTHTLFLSDLFSSILEDLIREIKR